MKYPAASSGVSSSPLTRHSVLDTESSLLFWIPAFAGMTPSRQAAGNAPAGIQVISSLKTAKGGAIAQLHLSHLMPHFGSVFAELPPSSWRVPSALIQERRPAL